jgi:hypothetical protein
MKLRTLEIIKVDSFSELFPRRRVSRFSYFDRRN